MDDIPLNSNNPFNKEDNLSKPEIKHHCNEDNIENCKSLQRIKCALLQSLTHPNTENISQNSNQPSLLNDFLHIKYDHQIHKNNTQFHKAYTFLTQDLQTQCDISQCPFIQKHFTDRSHNTTDTNILSRIHTYLFHSYDIYRFHPKDITAMESKQSGIDNNHKLQYISNIMQQKTKQYKLIHNRSKFCETYPSFNYDEIDLKHITATINAEENASKINSKYNTEQQSKLQQFKMVTGADDAITEKFLLALEWDIESATDRFFIYNGDVSRLPRPKVVKPESKNDEGKDDNKDNEMCDSELEIYNIGIKFSFWHSIKLRKKYLKAKYDNLKEELFENESIKCTVEQWNMFCKDCESLMDCDYIKKSVSFEESKDENKAEKNVSIEHLYALRLYTCYGQWREQFCAAFRVCENESVTDMMDRVIMFVNWAELLVESVGKLGKVSEDNMVCYRGCDSDYIFYKLIARFNVPTSATLNLCLMAQYTNDTGLIMELCNYNGMNAVYFDCGAISCFDTEEEVLWFGGENVLQIQALYTNAVNDTLVSYGFYICALQNLLRFMNGLEMDTTNMGKDSERILHNIFNHSLRTNNYKMSDIPPYIETLLQYYLKDMPAQIKYNLADITSENFAFLHDLFMKNNAIIHVSNLCNLFRKCKTIILCMSDDFVMTDIFCESLLEDMTNISKDVTLILRWNRPMLIANHSNLNKYGKQLSDINWQLNFSSTCVKLTSVAQFLTQTEILRQKQLWNAYDPKSDGNIPKSVFYSEDERIPLLVHGFIRRHRQCLIPLDIINLIWKLYGDYHTMYWKVSGNNFHTLMDVQSENNNTELVSEPYTIEILDYSMKFILKIKTETINNIVNNDRAVMLSLHAITDNPNLKQAITVQYTMMCEETKCEYRHMDVVGDGDGSEWIDEFLHVSELHNIKGLREVNFVCNIKVLHIWSQQDEDGDEVELMRIYHSGSTLQQTFKYKWILSQTLTPSNVTDEYTMYYSERFDDQNWTLIFVERADEFSVCLKSLSLPFGIGLLVVQCTVNVQWNGKNVTDTISVIFKYGDDDKNMGESKEWSKEELFGERWMTDFSLSELVCDVSLEVLHLEGINEEQIFRINWPLYGVVSEDESLKFNKNNFVLTKEQFETETFGFNYMIGVLRNEIEDLKCEIKGLKSGVAVSLEKSDGYIVNNESEAEEVKEWLGNVVGLPKYYGLLMQNGFNSLQMIKEINDRNDLEYIGVEIKAHQIKIMNKINVLKKQ